MAYIIYHEFNDLKTIFFLCSIVCILLGICAIFYIKMCKMLRKSGCPFGQVQNKMYLPESPFFRDSLARASRIVRMSVPAVSIPTEKYITCVYMSLILH